MMCAPQVIDSTLLISYNVPLRESLPQRGSLFLPVVALRWCVCPAEARPDQERQPHRSFGDVAVLTRTGMTLIVAKYVLPYGWTWPQVLLFGAIAAATDPVYIAT